MIGCRRSIYQPFEIELQVWVVNGKFPVEEWVFQISGNKYVLVVIPCKNKGRNGAGNFSINVFSIKTPTVKIEIGRHFSKGGGFGNFSQIEISQNDVSFIECTVEIINIAHLQIHFCLPDCRCETAFCDENKILNGCVSIKIETAQFLKFCGDCRS